MALTAVVHVGDRSPLGERLQPDVVAHLHESGVPRFLAYELDEGGSLDGIPGAYAPDLGADPAYPITDLVLATRPGLSSVGQRLETLDTKARANYGTGFREKVFDSDVEWGSSGFGRHYEARSQFEAHPFGGHIAVGLLPDAGDAARTAIAANLDRIDGATETFAAPAPDGG